MNTQEAIQALYSTSSRFMTQEELKALVDKATKG